MSSHAREHSPKQNSGSAESVTAQPANLQEGADVPAGRRRRVIRLGAEESSVSGASRDERDEGWSETASRSVDNAHDAELRRNLPPHWS